MSSGDHTNVGPTFRDRALQAMHNVGLNQKKMAAQLGIAENSIGNYLNQKRAVPLSVIQGIAQTCDVSVQWLIGEQDDTRKAVDTDAATTNQSACDVIDLLKAQLRECMDRERVLAIENGRLQERVEQLQADLAALRREGTQAQHSAPMGAAGGR